MKNIKLKLIYIIYASIILLNLSCDKDDSSTPVSDLGGSSAIYCLNMSYVVEGSNSNGIDYASDGEESRRIFTFSLTSTDDELCCTACELLSQDDCESNMYCLWENNACSENSDENTCIEPEPVPNANITFDWDSEASGANQPYLVTIVPPGSPDNVTSTNILANQSHPTNSSGTISAYWEDAGISGCTYLYAEYLDEDGMKLAEIDIDEPSPGDECNENSNSLFPNPFNVEPVLSSNNTNIPSGCGILTELTFSGVPTGLSNIIILDTDDNQLVFNFYSDVIENFCEAEGNNLAIENNNIWYKSDSDIEEFQFDIDGATVLSASGGVAEDSGYDITISSDNVTISSTVLQDISLDLDITPKLIIFNDLPPDTSTTITEIELKAIVENLSTDEGAKDISVTFSNLTPEYGTLVNSVVMTDDLGVAISRLVNIDVEEFDFENNTTETITIKASVYDIEGELIQEDTDNAVIMPQSIQNISQVNELNAAFFQSENLLNNVNIMYSDSIMVQVKDENNLPVQNVPIDFTMTSTDNLGFLSDGKLWTDDLGIVKNVYSLTPVDLIDGPQTIAVDITISLGQETEFTTVVEKTYFINANPNIEYDVAEFHLFPTSQESITFFSEQDTLGGGYQNVEGVLQYLAKNSAGAPISGVPVQFEIFESGDRSNGMISTVLGFTCCGGNSGDQNSEEGEGEEEEEEEASNENENSDNNTCNQTGMVCIGYENAILDTYDRVRAYITDPSDQTVHLWEDEITVFSGFVDETANRLDIIKTPPSIAVTDTSNVFCSDIFAIAKDSDGSPMPYIPVQFSLHSEYQQYGQISTDFELTDSDSTYVYSANSSFCTYPNIDFSSYESGTIPVNIDVSIPNNENEGTSETIQINVTENLPACPDCEESITLVATYYALPADSDGDNVDDIFTSLITATIIDSTGYPVPAETLVTFESLTEPEDEDDAGGTGGADGGGPNLTENIGSIDPYVLTGVDDNGDPTGQATALFNMSGDVGLATIIATGYGLSDTLHITLSSTSAATIEMIEPFPAYITIAGGGGAESTDIEVEIKDGNGNLITEPYLVRYEILGSAPDGVFVNEDDEDPTVDWQETAYGKATATINSGSRPGNVPIRVELYPLDLFDSNTINNSEFDLAYDDIGGGSDEEFGIITQLACLTAGGVWYGVLGIDSTAACGDGYGDDPNGISDNFDMYGISSAEGIPVTIVTGPPHSGEINASVVDIETIGGGLYRIPVTVEFEDIYANPVQDCTSVYTWVEMHAPKWEAIEYAINDTIKYGIETFDDDGIQSIDLLDSLSYVMINPANQNIADNPNQQNYASTSLTDQYGNPANNSNDCNCYADQLFDECGDGLGGTNCIWMVIPSQPGWMIGETRTGIPDTYENFESVPGVAWTYAFFSTSNIFQRITLKALAYGADGEKIVVDFRDSHQGDPFGYPLIEGADIALSIPIDEYDFGLDGLGTECTEPDWINTDVIGDDIGGGLTVTASVTDYYQFAVGNAILALTAEGSEVDSGYDVDCLATAESACDCDGTNNPYPDCDCGTNYTPDDNWGTGFQDQFGSTYDWIACNPVDTDRDGRTGDCSIEAFNDDCRACVAALGVWTPEQTDNGVDSGTYDDDQSLCITDGTGVCTWIIHYSEVRTPLQDITTNPWTYDEPTYDIEACLQAPQFQCDEDGVQIELKKTGQIQED